MTVQIKTKTRRKDIEFQTKKSSWKIKKKRKLKFFYGKGQGPQGPALPEAEILSPNAKAKRPFINSTILLSFNCSMTVMSFTSEFNGDLVFHSFLYKVQKKNAQLRFYTLNFANLVIMHKHPATIDFQHHLK